MAGGLCPLAHFLAVSPSLILFKLEVGFFFVKKGSEYVSFCKPQLCGVKATIHNTYPVFLAKIRGGPDLAHGT